MFSHAHWSNPTVRRLWSQIQLLTYCPPNQLAIMPGSAADALPGTNITELAVARRPGLSYDQVRSILSDIINEVHSEAMNEKIQASLTSLPRSAPLGAAVDRIASFFLIDWLNVFRRHGLHGEPADIAVFQAAAYAIDDPEVVEMTWLISRYGFILRSRDFMRSLHPHNNLHKDG